MYNPWSNSAKFIFVPAQDYKTTRNTEVFSFFDHIGVTNAVLIYQERNLLKAVISNQFLKKPYALKDLSKIDKVFPDKLANLNYCYKISGCNQLPRLLIVRDELVGVEMMVLETILRKQNAKVCMVKTMLNYKFTELMESLRLMETGEIDFSPNTFYDDSTSSLRYFERKINTYDENGYCALIPIPPRLSLLSFLLAPYDVTSWILLFLSLSISAFVWKLLRRPSPSSDSTLHFLFGIIAFFFGNSIPFRHNRRMQVVLLQLIIFMTFIMGNAYQSLIISLMSSSRDGVRFKTFDEMFSSDLKFEVDPMFYNIIFKSGDPLVNRMKKSRIRQINYQSYQGQNYAIIGRCDSFHFEMFHETNSNVSRYFYLLPEKKLNFYEKFPLRPFSPFYDYLQSKYDTVFESGIRQFWKDKLKIPKYSEDERQIASFKNEEYLLKMVDISGVFYILLFGYAVSIFVFILELSWQSFLRNFFKKIKKRSISKSVKQSAKRKYFVRQIEVRPAPAFV